MDESDDEVFYSPPPEMKRVCLLYMDILGYRQFNNTYKEEAFLLIDKMFQNVKYILKGYNSYLDFDNVKFKGYSDNLILYIELDGQLEDYQIFHDMILISAVVQDTAIMTCDIQVRGAITAGYCAIGDYVFGDAFMEAYKLESQIADWGRIMVSDDIAKEMEPYNGQLSHHLIGESTESGDRHYVDFLSILYNPDNNDNYEEGIKKIVGRTLFIAQMALRHFGKMDSLDELIAIAKIMHKNEKILGYMSDHCKKRNIEHFFEYVFKENLFYERLQAFNKKFSEADEHKTDEVLVALQELLEVMPYYRKNIRNSKNELKNIGYLNKNESDL